MKCHCKRSRQTHLTAAVWRVAAARSVYRPRQMKTITLSGGRKAQIPAMAEAKSPLKIVLTNATISIRALRLKHHNRAQILDNLCPRIHDHRKVDHVFDSV
jgi:hypothetical protein